MAEEVEKEYLSSLKDLSANCKPLINMLTLLAEENEANAPVIVQTIEKHLMQVSSIFVILCSLLLPVFL